MPYWAFGSVQSVDRSGGGSLLTLEVPRDQAVFFDMYDWNRVLQLKYMGENEKEERDFRDELARHHENIRRGDLTGVGAVQAALWCIRREWVVSWK